MKWKILEHEFTRAVSFADLILGSYHFSIFNRCFPVCHNKFHGLSATHLSKSKTELSASTQRNNAAKASSQSNDLWPQRTLFRIKSYRLYQFIRAQTRIVSLINSIHSYNQQPENSHQYFTYFVSSLKNKLCVFFPYRPQSIWSMNALIIFSQFSFLFWDQFS